MLIELRIQNYAVIERLSVRLEPGLNVLTGETGAGKSIVVGALSLLLGERASADVVRAGADRAVVEGVFDVARYKRVLALLAEQGLESEEGLLILRREVAAQGRSRAWINGSPTTAALVGELGRQLVDLHGQHEHQTLLDTEEQRVILDAFAGSAELAERVRAAYERLGLARRRLEELDRQRRETLQRADLLRFQVDEIEGARVQAAEEEKLEEEARRLAHSEELAGLSSRLHAELYAAEDAISERLAELRRTLEQLLKIDAGQGEARELLDAAYFNIEELGRRMGDYASAVEHDPDRLEEIRQRQDLLFRLKTKYGPALEDVIEAGRRARQELDALDNAAFERRELEEEESRAREELTKLGAQLTKKRHAAAERLAAEVMDGLPEVGLPGGRFVIELKPRAETGPAGAEDVEFLAALNVGFEPRALARIASGGELSRVMLALKAILARVDRIPTLVFDEIDVGIGGLVAHQVGERLRGVAEHHQVFVITHLPQIASRAHHHLWVEKVEQEGTTLTRLVELDTDNRIKELARMLGGESNASLEHARELLTRRHGE